MRGGERVEEGGRDVLRERRVEGGLAGPRLVLRLSMEGGAEGAGAKFLWLLLFIGAQCPVSPKQRKGRRGAGGSSYGCQPFYYIPGPDSGVRGGP